MCVKPDREGWLICGMVALYIGCMVHGVYAWVGCMHILVYCGWDTSLLGNSALLLRARKLL
jgi:hypothetical protein